MSSNRTNTGLAHAMQRATEFIDGGAMPFSFEYGGRPSREFLSTWRREEIDGPVAPGRRTRVIKFTDPQTGLEIRSETVVYQDYPVVEWTLYFRNTGKVNTPILAELQAADISLTPAELAAAGTTVDPTAPLRLHYNVGSPTLADDFRPLMAELAPGSTKQVATSGGRACNAHMPFFNLEGTGSGLILAISWGGQWATAFQRDSAGALRVTAGQELTHFTLHPGEEVRSPLIALLFYSGARVDGQNLWRRWMLAHNLPRPNGSLPAPMLAATGWLYFAPWGSSNAQAIKVFIDTYEARKILLDAWWTDAGWYDCDASLPDSGYSTWNYTGTWEADKRRFPNGLREIHEHAHKKGLKTILWFEPERVVKGTWLWEQHPEWLLMPSTGTTGQSSAGDTAVLDLGNPAALSWLIEHIDGILTKDLVDIYREDFNLDPLAFWRAHDTADRQGITEIRHVTGHLAFWDELRRRHPALLIDTCSSGSKRNELETLRRAVPLWRSDYVAGFTLTEAATARLNANQCMTYGIANWIPYFGTGVNAIETYRFRCLMGSSLVFDFDPRRDDLDVALWQQLIAQFKQVAHFYLGDFYPLTEYSQDNDVWLAWQFDDPKTGEGLIQAFRRQNCPEATACFRLHGLDPAATYEITDLDGGPVRQLSGQALLEQGLPVSAPSQPAALLLVYRRVASRP